MALRSEVLTPTPRPIARMGQMAGEVRQGPVRRGRPLKARPKYRPPSGCPRRSSTIFALEAGAGGRGSTTPYAIGSTSTTLPEGLQQNNRMRIVRAPSIPGSRGSHAVGAFHPHPPTSDWK